MGICGKTSEFVQLRLSNAPVKAQVGYAVADITAKAFYGVLIYMVAVRKSEAVPVVAGPLPSQA